MEGEEALEEDPVRASAGVQRFRRVSGREVRECRMPRHDREAAAGSDEGAKQPVD